MPRPEARCAAIRKEIDDLARADLRDMRLPTHLTDHVRGCPECKVQLDQVLALAEHLEAWPVPEPNRSITAGVMTQVAQLERDRRVDVTTLMRQCGRLLIRRVRVPMAVAALLVMGLFVSVALNVRHWQRPVLPVDPRTVVVASPEGSIVMPQGTGAIPVLGTVGPTEQPVLQGAQGLPAWLGPAQVAPTTFVIILGTPPFVSSGPLWSAPLKTVNHSL